MTTKGRKKIPLEQRAKKMYSAYLLKETIEKIKEMKVRHESYKSEGCLLDEIVKIEYSNRGLNQ